MKVFPTLCCILNMCILTQGRYSVEVDFFGYSNPTGRCTDCPIPAGQTEHSCCDNFATTNCTGSRRCDSFFYFCLRTLGDRRTNNGCSYFGSNTTFAIVDDGLFNITDLGLDVDPLILPGLTNNFIGVQLYIEVMDADLSLAAAPDELVDIMLIDLDQISLEPLPQRQNYTGVFNFVTMDLSVAALCANNSQPPDCAQCIPGFTGSDCSVNIDDCARVNCSGNGVCIDGTNSFSCDCDPGFAGQMCDVMDVIDNNCQPNPCGLNGRCVDGPSNYTCLCSPGYSGPQCKQADRFQIRNLLAPLIGGSVGALMLVILFLGCISLVSVCIMRCGGGDGKRRRHRGPALGDLTDSCYALGGDDPTHCSSATNMNHANPLRTHHTLDTALSPESSILSGVSQPVSVREREMHHQSSSPVVAAVSSGEMYSSSPVVAAVSSGEMYSIYDDPQYNTPEQRVPEYLLEGVYENMDNYDQEFIPEHLREVVYENTTEEELPIGTSTEHLYDYA